MKRYAVNYYGRMDGELLGGIANNKTYATKEEAITALKTMLDDDEKTWSDSEREEWLLDYDEECDDLQVSSYIWSNGESGNLINRTNDKDNIVNYEVVELDEE